MMIDEKVGKSIDIFAIFLLASFPFFLFFFLSCFTAERQSSLIQPHINEFFHQSRLFFHIYCSSTINLTCLINHSNLNIFFFFFVHPSVYHYTLLLQWHPSIINQIHFCKFVAYLQRNKTFPF